MIDYTELEVGDTFYECEYGLNAKLEVLTKPEKTQREGLTQWSWDAKNVFTGTVVNYLVTEGFEHYGPKLYSRPVYGDGIIGDDGTESEGT